VKFREPVWARDLSRWRPRSLASFLSLRREHPRAG